MAPTRFELVISSTSRRRHSRTRPRGQYDYELIVYIRTTLYKQMSYLMVFDQTFSQKVCGISELDQEANMIFFMFHK